ncbi:hypothetical protein BFP70_04245 [Thioclava sp. SK-1]|nr:hypothetical protein BFP70_04245 [Thioclava sp. SK-1]
MRRPDAAQIVCGHKQTPEITGRPKSDLSRWQHVNINVSAMFLWLMPLIWCGQYITSGFDKRCVKTLQNDIFPQFICL